jgi:hypothetical protein
MIIHVFFYLVPTVIQASVLKFHDPDSLHRSQPSILITNCNCFFQGILATHLAQHSALDLNYESIIQDRL